MGLRVLACVCESVFLKGLEAVFPDGDMVFCGGAVDEPTLFDMLPRAQADVLVYELTSEHELVYLSLLRRNFPELGIVVLLEPESEYLAGSAMERGVAECLPKSLTRETLFATLRNFNRSAETARAPRVEDSLFEAAAVKTLGASRLPALKPIDLASLFRQLTGGETS